MRLSNDQKVLALSLVYSYLADRPQDYCVWVPPHNRKVPYRPNYIIIAGHWRPRDKRNLVGALRCVCKLQDFSLKGPKKRCREAREMHPLPTRRVHWRVRFQSLAQDLQDQITEALIQALEL